MCEHNENEFSSVIVRTLGTTIPNTSVEWVMYSGEVECRGSGVEDNLVVSAIPSTGTVKTHNTQFPACWDVQSFYNTFSDGHDASMYKHKRVRSCTHIVNLNRRVSSLRVCCTGNVHP